jgi:hypothetical protein
MFQQAMFHLDSLSDMFTDIWKSCHTLMAFDDAEKD